MWRNLGTAHPPDAPELVGIDRLPLGDIGVAVALGEDEPALAGERSGAIVEAIVALIGLFWSAVEYGTGYAAPLLPYSWQVKLGETVLDQLIADEEECTGKAGLAAM